MNHSIMQISYLAITTTAMKQGYRTCTKSLQGREKSDFLRENEVNHKQIGKPKVKELSCFKSIAITMP